MPQDSGTLALILIGCVAFLAICGLYLRNHLSSHESLISEHAARTMAQEELLQATQAGGLILWSCQRDGTGFQWVGATTLIPLTAEPHDLQALIGALQEDHLRTELAAILANPTTPVDWEGHGTTRAIPHRKVHLRLQSQASSLRGILRDVTLERQLQDQLTQSQRQEIVGALARNISHELGNVLFSIDACAQALLLGSLPAEGREAGQHIQLSAQRGKAILRQILDLSRARAPEVRHEDLNGLLREISALLIPLFPRSIQLQLDLADALPPAPIDRDQMHQALLNLCLNAKDAMPQGGRLTLRSRSIDGPQEAPAWVLEVQDTGCGMAPEILDHVFDPRFTTKPPGQGTGLGLPITKGLLERMGATLEVHSRVGEGSTFRITLPSPSP